MESCTVARSQGLNGLTTHTGGCLLYTSTSIAIQEKLGADIIMQFDECSPYPCDYPRAQEAMKRTLRWLERCMAAKTRDDQALFGICLLYTSRCV